MITIMILGYLLIAAYIGRDVRNVFKNCKVEIRCSHGRKMVYLRNRKTGRLIGCSRNLFTLILQSDAAL